MATKYAGKTGLVYMSTTGTGTPVLVGGMREFTIDNSTEDIDTTSSVRPTAPRSRVSRLAAAPSAVSGPATTPRRAQRRTALTGRTSRSTRPATRCRATSAGQRSST